MRRRRRTPEAERHTAIHEAAHVVVSIRKKRRFISVTLEPTEEDQGCVLYRKLPMHRVGHDVERGLAAERAIEDSVVSSLAGGIAERRAARSDGVRLGRGTATADEAKAKEMLSWLSDDDRQIDAHYRLCRVRAEELVSVNWPAILALADALLSERTMGYRRAREFVSSLPLPRPGDLGEEPTGVCVAASGGGPDDMTQVERHDTGHL